MRARSAISLGQNVVAALFRARRHAHGGIVDRYVKRRGDNDLVHANLLCEANGIVHFMNVVLEGEKSPGEARLREAKLALQVDHFANIVQDEPQTAFLPELAVALLRDAVDGEDDMIRTRSDKSLDIKFQRQVRRETDGHPVTVRQLDEIGDVLIE